MSTVLAPIVPPVGLPLWDVIVSGKSLGPLPDDVHPGLVRVARADDVRAGDLVVGYFGKEPGDRWMPIGHVGELCYRALPARHPQGWDVLSLDGELFQWSPHDLVLIVPAGLAPETHGAGDRVERIAERFPYGWARPRRYAHHGTVIGVDDGTVTVRFDGDWLPTTLPATHIRHVNAEFVEEDRKTYGFAHGDTVALPHRPAVRGTVVDMWHVSGVVTAYVVWETKRPTDERARDLSAAAQLPTAA
ncbi:hypothetical protein [Streptomyces sp. NPDC058751]|uniref:hypothetical protein n=1 Tax=Streptomyces sp. NPDC058751 TaxID=3346623 RepID=UPI00368687D4